MSTPQGIGDAVVREAPPPRGTNAVVGEEVVAMPLTPRHVGAGGAVDSMMPRVGDETPIFVSADDEGDIRTSAEGAAVGGRYR